MQHDGIIPHAQFSGSEFGFLGNQNQVWDRQTAAEKSERTDASGLVTTDTSILYIFQLVRGAYCDAPLHCSLVK